MSSRFFSVIGLKLFKPWSFRVLLVIFCGVEYCIWLRLINKSLNRFATVWGSITIELLVFKCIGLSRLMSLFLYSFMIFQVSFD